MGDKENYIFTYWNVWVEDKPQEKRIATWQMPENFDWPEFSKAVEYYTIGQTIVYEGKIADWHYCEFMNPDGTPIKHDQTGTNLFNPKLSTRDNPYQICVKQKPSLLYKVLNALWDVSQYIKRASENDTKKDD